MKVLRGYIQGMVFNTSPALVFMHAEKDSSISAQLNPILIISVKCAHYKIAKLLFIVLSNYQERGYSTD